MKEHAALQGLGTLGVSGTVVGLVAGLGELSGYGLRLGIGYLSDRTHQYWSITTLGYFINIAVVPLLALAERWEVAAGLMIAERMGKAIRTPPRGVSLSHAAMRVGRGFGFGYTRGDGSDRCCIGTVNGSGNVVFTARLSRWLCDSGHPCHFRLRCFTGCTVDLPESPRF